MPTPVHTYLQRRSCGRAPGIWPTCAVDPALAEPPTYQGDISGPAGSRGYEYTEYLIGLTEERGSRPIRTSGRKRRLTPVNVCRPQSSASRWEAPVSEMVAKEWPDEAGRRGSCSGDLIQGIYIFVDQFAKRGTNLLKTTQWTFSASAQG